MAERKKKTFSHYLRSALENGPIGPNGPNSDQKRPIGPICPNSDTYDGSPR